MWGEKGKGENLNLYVLIGKKKIINDNDWQVIAYISFDRSTLVCGLINYVLIKLWVI